MNSDDGFTIRMVISVAQKMCFFHLHRDLGGLFDPLNTPEDLQQKLMKVYVRMQVAKRFGAPACRQGVLLFGLAINPEHASHGCYVSSF